MTSGAKASVVLRMFSSAVGSQVVLSAASFMVGILLIRLTSDADYGYFVLLMSAIILAVSLQHAYVAPAMINRMVHLDRDTCGELTGGLYREQRNVLVAVAVISMGITLVLWAVAVLDTRVALMVLASIVAILMALRREYFRMVLHAYRRAFAVLRLDVIYVIALVIGILLATLTSFPPFFAALGVAAAALFAGHLLSRSLRQREAWDPEGAPGILFEIAPLATWSTAGAAMHWTVSQGYAVLAAVTLDMSAVAAIAATRMLAMPVSLLSAGIGSLMLPITARWLIDMSTPRVFRRLVLIAAGLAVVSAGYFGVLWLMRDWVFDTVLAKDFAQRDVLLLLWAGTFVVLAVNQQLLWLLIARSRFRALTMMTLMSAIFATVCSYLAMLQFGSIGAPMGILLGELAYTVGVVMLCISEMAGDKQISEKPLPAAL